MDALHRLLKYDDSCPSCGDQDALVEEGFICIKCNLQFGICKYCGDLLETMVLWGWQGVSPDVSPASLTDREKRVVTATSFDEDEDQSFEEKSGYIWYRPPYIYASDTDAAIFVDDSTIWVFKCEKCDKHTQTHCD
jgi:hypothetical protein